MFSLQQVRLNSEGIKGGSLIYLVTIIHSWHSLLVCFKRENMKQTIQKKSYTKRKKNKQQLIDCGILLSFPFSFEFLCGYNIYYYFKLELFFGIVWCK